MVKTSRASSSLTVADVSGTPPALSTISASNADTLFWNGDLAAIATYAGLHSSHSSQAEANAFWGGVSGSYGGSGACQMAQSVGYAFQPILQAGNSFCYMKSVPTATSVTITPKLSDNSTLFQQQATDRLVKVNIMNASDGSGGNAGSQTIFITVFGTNSTGSEKYKISVGQCSGTTASSLETDTLDKSTGEFIASNQQSQNGQLSSTNITAFLLSATNGQLNYDTTKDRTAQVSYSNSGNINVGNITISANNLITSKTWGSFTFSGNGSPVTNVNKTYSLSSFSGDSVIDLEFLQAGFKTHMESGSFAAQDHSGAVEFNNTYYAALTSGSLYDQATAFNFSTDSFFVGTITGPQVDLSAVNCSATPDYTVNMDFSKPDIAAIQASCEKNGLKNMDFCNSDAVSSAMNAVQACFATNGNCN